MQAAVLDACVLYPASLRDFFMRLAVKLYQPKWTETIYEEWIHNALADRPDLNLSGQSLKVRRFYISKNYEPSTNDYLAQLTRTRDLMNRHGGACLVRDYEALIPTLILPDSNDRHVLAAAITAQASFIVTFNLSDFPAQALAPYHIRAVHSDDFAITLCQAEPELLVQLVQRHRQALVNPPKTAEECLATLKQCGLPKTVAFLQPHQTEI